MPVMQEELSNADLLEILYLDFEDTLYPAEIFDLAKTLLCARMRAQIALQGEHSDAVVLTKSAHADLERKALRMATFEPELAINRK